MRSLPLVVVALTACGQGPAPEPRTVASEELRGSLSLSFESESARDGIASVDGVRGKAVRFLGTGASLQQAGVGKLPIRDAFTLELWCRPEGHSPVRKSASYTMAAHSSAFFVNFDGHRGSLRAGVTTDAAKVRLTAAKGILATGVWQHVALVYDGSEVRAYVDANVVARQAATGDVRLYPKLALKLGTWHKTNQAYFGALDEVHVHDRALSENEIAQRVAASASPR